MDKNTGTVDRAVRALLGVVALGAAWMYWASLGTLWGGLLIVVGLVMLVTAAVSFCPIYRIFGMSTCKTSDK